MPAKKLTAVESEIVVMDSRISDQAPAYCFTNFSAAYSYLEKFYALEKPLRSYVQFYKALFERKSYQCSREDEHKLRFYLVKKLNAHTVEALQQSPGASL